MAGKRKSRSQGFTRSRRQGLGNRLGRAGKKISQLVLDFAHLAEGAFVVYRPVPNETTVLPLTPMPKRRSPPTFVKDKSGVLNLFATLDPNLDAVRGIWYPSEGSLRCHRENYARIAVPSDEIPARYRLETTVKRVGGEGAFGVGLLVGGRQTLLLFDSFGGEFTGLHLLDGKNANANDSTVKSKGVLPMNTIVRLVIDVTPGSVKATADGNPVLSWADDASRLSMDKFWRMPQADRLFLASYYTAFEVSSLTLQPRKD